jgi:APA family basic amino acid/polyamine antiporter
VPLVPLLGILISLLLMFSLPWDTWARFIVWLGLGMLIYFTYSRQRGVIRHAQSIATASQAD